jgi:soluble cytochrome b562
MSSRLEALRRRILEQKRIREQKMMERSDEAETPHSAALAQVMHRGAGRGLAAIAGGVAGGSGALAESIAKIFEQTKDFKPRFEELAQAIDLIERLGESSARTFAPLKAFQSHLVYLVASFDAIRSFQSNLLELSRSFPPVRPLQEELMAMTDAFEGELGGLIKTLEPARDFRERILVLARSLDQANELLNELHELQASFASSRPEPAGPSSGNDLLELLGRTGEREPNKES